MSNQQATEIPPSEADRIAFAYWVAERGDVWAALVCAIEDALQDLAEAGRTC
ncbi:hypothetical protein [Methylobacterium nigriterrae]|uniref:hypothetical protein n=1 Tax=Methylobacterium nigriterrae TaxID=3127512 RepID=UPI0030140DD8